MAASILLWKPSKRWQCIYIFIISFELSEFSLLPKLHSLAHTNMGSFKLGGQSVCSQVVSAEETKGRCVRWSFRGRI